MDRLLLISSCHVMSWPPSWFDQTGNSAIQCADHDNHTLEPNMNWIGSPVAKMWLFKIWHITRGALVTPILREGEVVGVIDHTIRKSEVGFL